MESDSHLSSRAADGGKGWRLRVDGPSRGAPDDPQVGWSLESPDSSSSAGLAPIVQRPEANKAPRKFGGARAVSG